MVGPYCFRMTCCKVQGGLLLRAGEASSWSQPLPWEVEAGKLLSNSGPFPFHILHNVHVFSALYYTFPRLPKALCLNHKQAHKTHSSNNLNTLFVPSLSTILQTYLSFWFTLVSFKTILLCGSRVKKAWLWIPTLPGKIE